MDYKALNLGKILVKITDSQSTSFLIIGAQKSIKIMAYDS